MTKDEALAFDLALEALESWMPTWPNLIEKQKDAITAIKQARSAPVQEPVAHTVISGALFDFMGWLTSRKERIVLSSADEASPAVDAIRDFAKMRGLSLDDAQVQDWQDNATPTSAQRTWVGLTDDEYFILQMKIKTPMISVQDYIDAMRMVEAKLKGKNT
jgi:hypothetical protein